MHQEQARILIDSCIKEFRTWQSLIHLVHAERRALTEEDTPCLAALAKRKETILSELTKHSQAQQALEDRFLNNPCCCLVNCHSQLAHPVLFEVLFPDEQFCLQRIAEGIEALIEQLEDLAQGNYALAACVTKRAWILQAWLQEDNLKTLNALRAASTVVHDSLESIGNRNIPRTSIQPSQSQPQSTLELINSFPTSESTESLDPEKQYTFTSFISG